MTNNLFFDNTRISAYMTCPRKYYFRHRRHWRRDGQKIALGFGSCIHSAMDFVWAMARNDITDEELAATAYAVFLEKWKDEGLPDDVSSYGKREFRQPGLGHDIIIAYVKKNRPFIQGIELIGIEQPFVVPVFDLDEVTVYYIGRLDKVWKDLQGYWIDDHKTTSSYRKAGGPFQESFLDSFSPDNQMSGYLYGGHLTYGEEFKGVYVDAILVHKEERGFQRIPLMRRLASLDSWLTEVTQWISNIVEANDLHAEGYDPNQAYLMNTTSCKDWSGCTYRDICKYGDPNPDNIEEPPQGFIEAKWEPFNVEQFEEVIEKNA